MTPDLERMAKAVADEYGSHICTWIGEKRFCGKDIGARSCGCEDVAAATLRALETLSPEVVETMCHAMCNVNNVDPNEMIAIFHPGSRRTLHHHRWEIYRNAVLAAHRAMIKAVIGGEE